MNKNSVLRKCLKEEFNITGGRLRRISHTAFNEHYILKESDRKQWHIVARPKLGRADDSFAIESRLRMASKLRGNTSLLCKSWIETSSGKFTTETKDDRVVSVRLHLGTKCKRNGSPERMAKTVSSHTKELQRALPVAQVQHLRYLATQESLFRITKRINSFIRNYSKPEIFDELICQVNSLINLLSDCNDKFVHGDLHYSNLIDVGNEEFCVIDHECTHEDLEYFDAAHLWLSVVFSKDLSGRFDKNRAIYVEDIFSRLLSITKIQLRETARYVLLKKIALVEQPKHLYLESRMPVLRWLTEKKGLSV